MTMYQLYMVGTLCLIYLEKYNLKIYFSKLYVKQYL